jgi:hypothetical protein
MTFDTLHQAQGGINVFPSDESSAILSYNVYRDGVQIANIDTSTYVDDTGIVNGQSYRYSVSGVNTNGEGSRSAPVSFISSTKPDPVVGLQAVHGNNQLTLSWNLLDVAPSEQHSDQGDAVQMYKIYMAHRSDPFSLAISAAPSVATTVLTGLLNGDEYRFKITAVNANGESDDSEIVSAVPSTSPNAVRNVHIVGSATQLQIIWKAPQQAAQGGVAYMVSELTTRYVEVEGLNTNVQYTVAIYAYNDVDTNFVIYSTETTTTPTPIEITNLAWDHSGQQRVTWSYSSNIFSVIDFLIVALDMTSKVQ